MLSDNSLQTTFNVNSNRFFLTSTDYLLQTIGLGEGANGNKECFWIFLWSLPWLIASLLAIYLNT